MKAKRIVFLFACSYNNNKYDHIPFESRKGHFRDIGSMTIILILEWAITAFSILEKNHAYTKRQLVLWIIFILVCMKVRYLIFMIA
jgi:hypothetical protein